MADVKTISKQIVNGNGASGVHTDEALSRINRELHEKAVAERAKELNIPYVDLSLFPINPDVLHVVLPEDSKRALLMPFFKSGKKLRIAVNDPNKPEAQQVLKKLELAGFEYQLNLASDIGISDAQELYESEQYKPRMERKIIVEDKQIFEKELKNFAELKTKIETLPAEEALDMFHASAINSGASDVHYQPEEKFCTIRFRIDGILHKVFDIPKETYAALINQLKYKAKMKLNITTVPQDGRYTFIVNDRKVDVRASSLPTEFGESLVCRILDTGKHFSSFEELGFSGRSLELFKRLQSVQYGMILCTGPTGSGKTTTLYALLTTMNQPDVKIITLEDPIEYHIEGITQSQVNEKRDYSFATGLRSILRQDPDVVMVGEIRDLSAAETACQAALTGHLMLSTLHTNNAISAISRMTTIGVPPFVVAPSLHTVIAQRLVRKICTSCSFEREIKEEEKKILERTFETAKAIQPEQSFKFPEKLRQGKGCETCNLTGFRGQMLVAEIFEMTDEMREAVLNNASEAKLFEIARKNGMLTMQEDGFLKVMAGLTTLDEIYRVTAV